MRYLTVLCAQQPVEHLLHHDGIQFDQLRESQDHLFLQSKQTKTAEDTQ